MRETAFRQQSPAFCFGAASPTSRQLAAALRAGCRAAGPLAAARGVWPCGVHLFLNGCVGGKKHDRANKLEFVITFHTYWHSLQSLYLLFLIVP